MKSTFEETDGRLLDVKSGRYRRIPFQGDLIVSLDPSAGAGPLT